MSIMPELKLLFYIGIFYINIVASNELRKSKLYCSNLNYKYPANLLNISTLIEEFPHMAAIQYTYQDEYLNRNNSDMWICAGVLISEKYVLTTAHCLQCFDDKNCISIRKIRLGSNNLNDLNNNIKIAKILRHPDYKPDFLYNDIGLIELQESINITDSVRPACLETEKTSYQSLIASSYQLFLNDGNGVLAKWSYEELIYDKCKQIYKNLTALNNGIVDDEQICVSDLKNNSTELESGDPLQIFDSSYGYKVVGIIDFGEIRTKTKQETYVCNRISHHIDWIESIVWPDSLNLV